MLWMQFTRIHASSAGGGTRVPLPPCQGWVGEGLIVSADHGMQHRASSIEHRVDSQRVIPAVEPLTAHEFAPYGNVIEAREDAPFHMINRGFSKRFDSLAAIDTSEATGTTAVTIVSALPRALPFNVVMLERHLLES